MQYKLSLEPQSSRAKRGDLINQIAASSTTPRNDDVDLKNLKWIVQNAGKCKVFISGGSKASDEEMFSLARIVKTAGCAGMAIGRNIWQRDDPVEFAKKIGGIIYA